LAPGRLGYVHVARGTLQVNGQLLAAGDAALLRGESQVELGQGRNADVLVFDLAP
jgi:redox-sensitive bicupin YhaK (pirin superfamily)